MKGIGLCWFGSVVVWCGGMEEEEVREDWLFMLEREGSIVK